MMTLLAFIVTIGILVTIHEYGHFQVARWCGVKVLRFSIGFGKPIWQKTLGKDRTEFVLAAIPLGGFVKMLDENELKAEQENKSEKGIDSLQANYSEADLKRAFNRQSVWKRIAIVLAGPLANLLLAIFLYWILFILGVTATKPMIGEVQEGSLAAEASLISGELIQTIDGKEVKSWQEARWLFLEKSLETKSVKIEAVNNHNELLQHTLSFDGVDTDAEVDILKKLGIQEFRPKIPAVIGEVLPDSPARKAGLMSGDKILSIDKVAIEDWEQVVNLIKNSPNKTLQIKIERTGNIVQLNATPEEIKQNNQTLGRMGAAVKINQNDLSQFLIELHYSPLESLQKAISKTWDTSIFSLKMLGKMVVGEVSLSSISGPVTIATYAGESANLGLKTFLGFLALVSISIGVLNLLPIPVLDGGHLMYYIAEIIKGSPVSEQVLLIGQKIGFIVLGLLMSIAIFNDLNRLIITITTS
jgi:regulator of sigma E protease